MIKVDNLNIHFGYGATKIHAVRNFSLHVKHQDCYGLVGESGSGKSTVLRAVAGLNPHWTGVIRVDGDLMGAVREKIFFKKLQMVFQDPYGSLHPRHTVNTILAEPARIHGIKSINQAIDQILVDVGLGPSFRYRFPHQLSGGQRQRIAIARAIILRPEILLLDEPTSALDVSVQAEILNLLNELKQRYHMTYILVSHDLAVISHMCNRLAVMKKGVVVEELRTDALQKRGAKTHYVKQLLDASFIYSKK